MKTAEMMKVIEIQNFEAPELDVYARLTENQLVNRADPAKGMFIAESPKVIMRALDAGCAWLSVLMEKRQLETEGEALEAIRMCSSTNKEFPVYVAEFEVLAKLTGFKLTRECFVPCTGRNFGHRRKSAGTQGVSRCLRMS